MRDDLSGKKPCSYVHGVLILLTFTLLGCDHNIEQVPTSNSSKHIDDTSDSADNNNLWQVAGQAAMPKKMAQKSQAAERNRELTTEEKKLVGRYSVIVPCTDPIARCGQEKNDAVEFILNLMPDGSVYRLIKRLGRIQVDSRSFRYYYKDSWGVKQINARQYIITYYSSSGMRFFYRIDGNGNLVMDVQRNKLVNLQAYRSGYPFPNKIYTLVKLPD